MRIGGPLTPGEPEPLPPGRSLVPVDPPAESANCFSRSRPSALFLAQLIGTAQGASQTRARRRLGAADAAAVYRDIVRQTAPDGRYVRGSL